MLEEVGTVVAIEEDALWVETQRQSACGGCSAKQGCGQHALGKALATSARIRVLLRGEAPGRFRVNQQVKIGIPEDVVVKGALLAYLLPLVLMILCAWAGFRFSASDGISALGALLGLVFGGALVRLHARKHRNDPRLQPVLLEAYS